MRLKKSFPQESKPLYTRELIKQGAMKSLGAQKSFMKSSTQICEEETVLPLHMYCVQDFCSAIGPYRVSLSNSYRQIIILTFLVSTTTGTSIFRLNCLMPPSLQTLQCPNRRYMSYMNAFKIQVSCVSFQFHRDSSECTSEKASHASITSAKNKTTRIWSFLL